MPCGKVLRRISKTFSKKSRNSEQPSEASRASPSISSAGKTKRDNFNVPQKLSSLNETAKAKNHEGRDRDDDFDVLPTPFKCPCDKNEYVVVKLANGFYVTIISDTEGICSDDYMNISDDLDKHSTFSNGSIVGSVNFSDRKPNCNWLERDMNMTVGSEQLAACAVTVNVGSFNDPDEIPGLCHLLEHVVSMGSDKYPEENELEVHLSKCGGSYDAQTECEYMTFHVDCREQYLKKTLEIFSRIFIAPLIRWESVKRERNVVDSEFAEHFHSDSARRMQIISSTAVQNNPAIKFTWGNLKTLQENVGSEELLKALGDFRQKHFTAFRMKMAIQARMHPKVLLQYVRNCFSDISIEGKVRFSDSVLFRDIPKEPFILSKFCRIYRVQSMGEICELNINWGLPPMIRKYKTKPLEYLSYVIGAEGQGSLIAHLRKHRLALFLTAEVEEGGICSNSIYTIFTICVALTEDGRQNIKEVITSIFSYLKMLRVNDPSEEIFNELKDIADTNFRFSQNINPVDRVIAISQNMTVFPPEDYLTGWALFYEFSSNDIQEYTNKIIPSRANILLQMKDHDMELDQEELWFHTKYRSDEVPREWLKEWETVDVYPNFSLPKSNPYLASEFRLVNQVTGTVPEKVLSTELCEIWHKSWCADFKVPFAAVYILINIPKVSQSAENTVRQTLLAKMFTYHMIDELYYSHVAQLEVQILTVEYGMEITIYGFSEKIHHILKTLAQGFVAFREQSDQQHYMLDYLKTVQRRNLRNTILSGSKLLEDVRKSVLTNMTHSSGEKLLEIDKITVDKIKNYIDGLFKGVYVQALVEGNIIALEARNMIHEFVEVLNMEPGDTMLVQPLVREIPIGNTLVSIATFHPEDSNLYTLFYYQYGPAKIEEIVAMQLFVGMMREPLFDELRTKEQLGYSVSIDVSDILGVLGISISINSQVNKYSPEYVRTRIESFTKSYLWYFKMLTPKEFQEAKQAFMALKKMKSTSLRDTAFKDWWEIRDKDYQFDRMEKEILCIGQLEKKNVYDLAAAIMSVTSKSGKLLIIQIVGRNTHGCLNGDEFKLSTIDEDRVVYQYVDSCAEPTTKVVKDLMNWKSTMQSYPKL